jgi:hypothetical protein
MVRREAGLASGQMPVSVNMLVPSRVGPVVVDAENAIVVFTNGETESPIHLPLSVGQMVAQRVAELRDLAGERVVTPVVAAGPAPVGILIWLIGNPSEIVAGIVDPSGSWTLLANRTGTDELPRIVQDVLLWDDELFVLAEDGIRVYEVQPL